ncbi:asparagine synthase [Nakamurella multipartita DSM 44233]|uniref:Asparagine synthase n=2 Tax=Nakamurella TaxID=53460 RepID=C8XKW0_NAKMY|nr:asparagine synthase [Nakamurella multipartita DSM 44233]
MVEYLVTLHPLNNRTVLRDVTLLPGGGRITWAPNSRPRLSVNRLYLPSDDRMSDDGAIAEFETVWSTVMVDMAGRIGTKRAGLGLSGGLDSRAIAGGCVDHGFRPATFTYGNVHTNEGRVSSHVAEVLGLDHTIIPVRQDCLLRDTSRAVSLLDGAHSPAEMYELWFCDVLRNFADVVINGLDGDVFWGNDKALGVVGSDGILHAQLRRYGPELARLREFLAPDFGNWATDQFTRSLDESMTEWDLSSRADMVVFWRIYNRQLRWGNALTTALRRSGLRTELPFRDSRFLRFSARLTPAQRRNGQLYLETHRRLFSQISGIARSSDGNAPDHLDHVYWSGESPYTRQLARLAMRHPVSAARRAARQLEKVAVNRSPDWLPLVPWKNRSVSRSSIFPADLWLRTSRIYRERLLELLESSPTLSIFSSLAIDQFADSIRSGQANSGALLLAKIATLQAWFADYSRREASRQLLT